jgi:hypothetical protein
MALLDAALVFGGQLAAERAAQWPVALLVLGLSIAWDVLFLAFDTLPATVPVAAALLIAEAVRRPEDRCSEAEHEGEGLVDSAQFACLETAH